jgi:maltoporin
VQSRQFNSPNIFDLVYVHQFDPRLTYSFESLYGYQSNVPDIGFANWFGAVNYLTYQWTGTVSTTARLEFFDDAQGQRTGFDGLYTALTVGLTFKPCRSVLFRPELRYDYNVDSRPYENRHGLFTATADLILRW